LIKIVKDEDITSLSVEEGGAKIEVKREKGMIVPEVSETSVSTTNAPAKQVKAKEKHEQKEEKGMVAITSPMVGTFYRAPSPDSPSFVEVGDRVTPGKVVCIIEAMKLFNEIEAEVTGTVAKVLIDNTKPVEYGQKLILIKKE
jgi:acetyl-CoA carboxylase biotin carboxyl carrier protein